VAAPQFLAANDGDPERAATAYAASALWRERAGLDRPLAAVPVAFEPLLLEQCVPRAALRCLRPLR
jgi:hypothetical protein